MIKKSVKYKDFNDNPCEEDLYFNLSADEWMEIDVDHQEGYGEYLKRVVSEGVNKVIYAEFKKLILTAYGQKTSDGKSFRKSSEISHEFSQTAAYQTMFLEIATDGDKMADFINGLIPKEFADRIAASNQQIVAGISMPTDVRDPAFKAMQEAQRGNVINIPLPPPTV